MEKNCEYFMNLLISVIKGNSSLDSIKAEINENYKDKDDNGIYHYFAQYSLEKFYILNYNKDKTTIIKPDEFENLKKQYLEQLHLFVDILDELNCDSLSPNKDNQTPLICSINNKNYSIAKILMEKTHNLYIMERDDYYNIFNLAMNRGDCLRDDCIDFISFMLTLEDANTIKIFNEHFLNSENAENCLTPIVILCKDFSENIYNKINSIIEIVGSNYNENFYEYDSDESLKKELYNDILFSVRNAINDFINNKFNPLLRDFIKYGADINYIEKYKKQNKPKSAFMYLMSYPFFNNINEFVEKNGININYQDESGQTALMYLINNKEKICQISTNFENTLNYFINENNNVNLTLTDNNGISAFGLLLMKGCFSEALSIYINQRFINEQRKFNLEILLFIVNYLNQKVEYKKILNCLSIFGKDLQTFNDEHKRTLLHYICMYSPDSNTIFEELILEINKLYQNFNEKDIFNRNPLFYLLIEENEKNKNKDPYIQLEACLSKIENININDVDIFGNSLLFYAVQARAYKTIKLLLKHSASLDLKNKEGNTVYTTAILLEDYELFLFLYNIKKDNKIFNQKIYSSKQIELYKSEKSIGKILLDFYKKTNISFNSRIFIDELEKDFDKNYNNFSYNTKNIKRSKYRSDYINLLSDYLILFINGMINDFKIKNEDKNIINFYINNNRCTHIREQFQKDLNLFIAQLTGEKSILLSENMFRFCKSKNNEKFCRFMINKNYNLISICNDLLSLNYEDELHYYISQVLYEEDLLNLKNEEQITIFHILAKKEKDQLFYKLKDFGKYDISNLFDNLGNTPMYYACQESNIYFIETFSKYSFESLENDKQNVNYALFGESQNGDNIPLKSLYHNLNKKDMNILKLIIDLSLEMKVAYILDIFISLVENYSTKYNDCWDRPYTDNLNTEDYVTKVIGLYLFYKKELNGNFSLEEFNEINPVFYCLEHKNFEFLFEALQNEKKLDFNCRNKDGKNILHLIVEMKEDSEQKYKKSEILERALLITDHFNVRDSKGMYPIDYAYLNKDNDCINILINRYNKSGLKVPQNKDK